MSSRTRVRGWPPRCRDDRRMRRVGPCATGVTCETRGRRPLPGARGVRAVQMGASAAVWGSTQPLPRTHLRMSCSSLARARERRSASSSCPRPITRRCIESRVGHRWRLERPGRRRGPRRAALRVPRALSCGAVSGGRPQVRWAPSASMARLDALSRVTPITPHAGSGSWTSSGPRAGLADGWAGWACSTARWAVRRVPWMRCADQGCESGPR